MTMMPLDAAHWPHAIDCPCSDCEVDRAADASIARDGDFIARYMLAGFSVGLALVALHGWWAGTPGIDGMVGL